MSMPEKKAAVFRAVLHLLRQGRPLGDLKVSEIAEAAGIGKGTVYEYFPSREELLRDAMQYSRAQGFAELYEAISTAEGFAARWRVIEETARQLMQCGSVFFSQMPSAGFPQAALQDICGGPQERADTRRMIGEIMTCLTAAAVEEGGAPSPALTLDFFIGEEHTLPVLSLVTDSPRRFSEIYEGSVKDRECAGNLSFYAPEGSFSIGCGVEMKGHTSLFAPKKSLGVSFRGCYGAETLAYDIFGEGPAEFSELSIRAGQDYSSTVFRNELMQELCAELDTTVTQRSRYCVLYINGEYWGIYCLKDDITRQYYANLTGTAKEDVTMLSSPVPQSAAVYTEALGLWKDTSLTREEAYERFCAAVDMDGFIDWVLLEGYCANVDIKSNLRYLRTGDGPWQIVFYDLDWAFQTRNNCFFNLIGPEQTAQIAPTIRWLFGIDGFRERLLTRYAELTETTLSDGHVTEKIDEFRALLAPEMARERARWSGTAGAWEESVDALRANIADGYAAASIQRLCELLGADETERQRYFGF